MSRSRAQKHQNWPWCHHPAHWAPQRPPAHPCVAAHPHDARSPVPCKPLQQVQKPSCPAFSRGLDSRRATPWVKPLWQHQAALWPRAQSRRTPRVRPRGAPGRPGPAGSWISGRDGRPLPPGDVIAPPWPCGDRPRSSQVAPRPAGAQPHCRPAPKRPPRRMHTEPRPWSSGPQLHARRAIDGRPRSACTDNHRTLRNAHDLHNHRARPPPAAYADRICGSPRGQRAPSPMKKRREHRRDC